MTGAGATGSACNCTPNTLSALILDCSTGDFGAFRPVVRCHPSNCPTVILAEAAPNLLSVSVDSICTGAIGETFTS